MDVKDVYWAKQGRWSVDPAVGLIALTGSTLAAAPIGRVCARTGGMLDPPRRKGTPGNPPATCPRGAGGLEPRATGVPLGVLKWEIA